MSLVRHESQQYANPAALTAETVTPTANDEVHVESLNRRFNWLEGSSATADDKYVIDQTNQTANGRWAATAVEGAKVFTGSVSTGAIPNGNTAVVTVALTDGASSTLLATSGAALGITNGGTFPTNVFLDSIVLTADNTAQVTVVNESGNDVAAFNVDVKAIDYTGVASAGAASAGTPYARKILIADFSHSGNYRTVYNSSSFVAGNKYIAVVGAGGDLSNIGYVADNVPFIATGSTATSYTMGASIAHDITTCAISVTEQRNDLGVTLTASYKTALPSGSFWPTITLSQPLLNQGDVIWGACTFNAEKLSSTELTMSKSDRFFVEQVI